MRLVKRAPGSRADGGSTARPPRVGLRDLGDEALAGLLQRPGRTVLTMLGTVLGIGTFVTILGLTATAQAQVSDRFDALAATSVTVDDLGARVASGTSPITFPADADARVAGLDGVQEAGVWWGVRADPLVVRAGRSAVAATADGVGVTAADPGALRAMGPTGVHGRLYDDTVLHDGQRIAVLGRAAAERLGVLRLDGVPAVFVNGVPYTVVGIVSDFTRAPDQLLSVIVPTSTALTAFGTPQSPRAAMRITTRIGAAQVVAREVAVALRPDRPDLLQVNAPADPTTLRNGVSSDFDALFLVLAGVSLLIGALGIVNTTTVSVLERTPEIGLRRALGARRRVIGLQFLVESFAIGAIGGLVGTCVAILVVLGTSLAREWTPVMPTWTLLLAPLAGALLGLVAGAYPSVRAARVEPVVALRS